MTTKKTNGLLLTVKVIETEKEWYNNAEACKYLGIKPRMLRELRNSGRLKFYSLNPNSTHAHTFIRKTDMDKLFKPVI